MEDKKYLIYWRIAFFFLILVFVSILFKALSTPPTSGDSLDYHIPIAQSFLDGSVINPHRGGYDLLFYPGISNGFLVPFILLGIPLNLFNIVGWIFFIWSLYYLARKVQLSTHLSLIFAGVLATLPTVVRTMDTQGIDILLGGYFALTLAILLEKKLIPKHYLFLGILFGLILGTKYSGPLYALVLVLLYGRKLLEQISLKKVLVFVIPILLLGGVWYLRNFIITGNPMYPGHFLMFKGNPTFHLQDWIPIKTIIQGYQGSLLFIQSLFSEFLLLSFLIFLPVALLKVRMSNILKKLIVIGLLNFIIYLFLPSWPENIISDMRYNYVVFIPLSLAALLLLQKSTYLKYGLVASIFMMSYITAYLGHRPKLFFLAVTIYFVVFIYQRSRNFFKL